MALLHTIVETNSTKSWQMYASSVCAEVIKKIGDYWNQWRKQHCVYTSDIWGTHLSSPPKISCYRLEWWWYWKKEEKKRLHSNTGTSTLKWRTGNVNPKKTTTKRILQKALPGLLWNSPFFSLVCSPSHFLSYLCGKGDPERRLGLYILIYENKAWKKRFGFVGLVLERKGDEGRGDFLFDKQTCLTVLFFGCFRQTIFCKWTVTSVLFHVYYTDSYPTLKMQRVEKRRIPIIVFLPCVCVSLLNYECADILLMVRVMEHRTTGGGGGGAGGMIARYTLHFKEMTPTNASSVSLLLTMFMMRGNLNVLKTNWIYSNSLRFWFLLLGSEIGPLMSLSLW